MQRNRRVPCNQNVVGACSVLDTRIDGIEIRDEEAIASN